MITSGTQDLVAELSDANCGIWNFAREKEKKKKQDLQEDKKPLKPLPIPEKEGHSSWGTNPLYFHFAWQKK